MTLKALSLTQPWATLLAHGAKRVETRSWSTSHRGWLAIHAAKGFPRDAIELCLEQPFAHFLYHCGIRVPSDLPRGAIVGLARLRGCYRIGPRETWPPRGSELDGLLTDVEREFGNYKPGRWAWVFGQAFPLREPIECKGSLGLWTPPADVLERVKTDWLGQQERTTCRG